MLARISATILVLLLTTAQAQPQQGVIILELSDGSMVTARSVETRGDTVFVTTDLGVRMEIPKNAVRARRSIEQERVERRRRAGFDPTYSRLMLAPTGRPLARGHGYISSHFFVLPAVAYGVTDRFSLLGGMSVLPGVNLSEQVHYIVPRYSLRIGQKTSLSFGSAIGAFGADDDGGTAGIGFLMATRGGADQSVTLGLGLGWAKGHDDPARFMNGPILGFGFHQRLRDHLALVSESWLITGEGVGLEEQPFGLSLRFFSGGLSVDLGVLLIGEVLKEGFPIPWLSFAYHFGS